VASLTDTVTATAGGTAATERWSDWMTVERLRLIRHSFPDQPELSTAVSRTILRRVAAGELPPTIRIHRPGNEVAFGRQDLASPGYPAAAEAARAAGFAPVERLAGGRAAVFHSGTIAIARAYTDPQPPKRTYARFEEMADLIVAALRGLEVDARVGEVPGEYCPGAYSVNARGATKLAGIGQRMIRGGAHLGGVVVASGGREVARVLEPVYAALELDWDPATSGSVSEELDREVDPGELEDAVIAELAKTYELVDAELDPDTMRVAAEVLDEARRAAVSRPGSS
jgi:octanoyl-[GcvH]:protein N-octanoyltransferase